MSHTPGPWRYEEEFPGSGFVVARERNIAVAEDVWGSDLNSIREPNARLIAAAPELLDAAKDLELWYRAGGCRHTSPDTLMKRLMAAIDEAEGRAS